MSEGVQGGPVEAAAGIGWTLNRDERLAKRAAAGDSSAFETLFKRYQQPLYRYCRAILTEPVDAEDAVQATMVKALRALPGERREIALRPWLYRVAHNESISILRARRETDRARAGGGRGDLLDGAHGRDARAGAGRWSPTWRRCPSASARAWSCAS